MSELPELRRAALGIFRAALARVDARSAVRRAVRLDGSRLIIRDTAIELSAGQSSPHIYSIAIGKAAFEMASALDEILRVRLTAGLITGPVKQTASAEGAGSGMQSEAFTPTREAKLSSRWRALHGGHPLPDEASLAAARHAFDLLRRAEEERALVIFLISGGGSAMIESLPGEGATLADLREANRVLVSCGANISEVNSVRRAFSGVKGGALAARAPSACQVTLIISDTGAGDEATVASGPTLVPPVEAPDVRDVIARYELDRRLPPSILSVIQQRLAAPRPASTSRAALRAHYVLLDNGRAIEAAVEAARAGGMLTETAPDLVEQPVMEGSAALLSRLRDLQHRAARERGPANSAGDQSRRPAVCLISGGEFACPVRGGGVGGRNAETVLRCAIEMDEWAHLDAHGGPAWAHMVALSAGTDGIDGNSPAAGALADETTLTRARSLGIDAQEFLDASNAYTFFDALGDAVITGPTGTNVRDLRLLLAT